ncbi:hypothetical protein L1887_38707 [Cichorium endivia]|nr:hypothetical protein L1887_38707 [Cichorium endivia]
MGEEQKVEEPKVEETKVEEPKPEEKKEENAEEKPPAEEKKEEEPKPPAPFVLFIDLHCVGCAKKIEKSLLRIPEVVGLDIDMVKNQVTIKGVAGEEGCDWKWWSCGLGPCWVSSEWKNTAGKCRCRSPELLIVYRGRSMVMSR